MGPNLLVNYGEAVAAILFCIGFTNLLLQTNLIKKIIGLNIMDSAIYLFLAEKGYIAGRAAPIVTNGVTSVEAYINPIPSGLVLTGIVVSVSVSALMLSLTIRLYLRYHTLNLDEIAAQLKKEGKKMDFVCNFPFFSILLSLFSGTICSILPGRAAKVVNRIVIAAVGVMSGILLVYLLGTGESFVYWMGHFPAPWGNEIRAGVLEAGMALFFCIIMYLSMAGGAHKLFDEVEENKHNLYYILINLLLSSLLALVYTNDMFTAYVFVEINTISACGLIMIRQVGRTIEAAVRYMIMSLLGSGLLLFGLCIMYDLTGHLLMSNIKESVSVSEQTRIL